MTIVVMSEKSGNPTVMCVTVVISCQMNTQLALISGGHCSDICTYTISHHICIPLYLGDIGSILQPLYCTVS